MARPKEFAKRMKQIGQRIEVNATQGKRRVASAVQQAVILGTPVDTGRARGNWFATVGIPRTFSDENAKDPSGFETITKNEGAIKTAKTEQPIFITNNLPYIVPLNNGHSAQAPKGYVEKAVAAGKRAAKDVRLLK